MRWPVLAQPPFVLTALRFITAPAVIRGAAGQHIPEHPIQPSVAIGCSGAHVGTFPDRVIGPRPRDRRSHPGPITSRTLIPVPG